jgi:hypothetical protein
VVRRHPWTRIIGRRVRFLSYEYRGHDFVGETGTVIDVDGDVVIWTKLDNKSRVLEDCDNELIVDDIAAKRQGYDDALAMFEAVTETIE